jgi:glycosyltransferase involved in cell wall biosynthesis
MKKVLIITYYWPPAGGIAVQRITKFCKYLPDYDWEPIILTVKDGNYENMDPSMLSETKQIKKVYRALSIEPHLFYHLLVSRFHKRGKTDKVVSEAVNTRTSLINRVAEHIRLNLFIPDTRIGWLHNAYRCGKKIIAELKPDIIFSTAPPYTPHLVARKLHKFSGIPWVADFRDPWVENTLYNTVNRLGLVVSINRLLEKKVLTQASALTFTGQQLRDLYLSKLDNSHAANATVITNGYDEEDFNALHVTTEAGSKFYITYFGSLYNKRFNALAFNVVKEFIKENKSIREHICVRFIGSVDRESSHTKRH